MKLSVSINDSHMPTTTQNLLSDWEDNTVLIELASINQTLLETFKIGTVMIFVYTVNCHYKEH